MIFEKTGDIFKSGAEVLVNPVNCVGVMGAGLAKQFKIRFPEMFEDYKELCGAGYVRLGEVNIHSSGITEPRWIISFPTKHHFKESSKLSSVTSGLKCLRKALTCLEIERVAIPALGCGLGGLMWSDVRAAISKEFASAPFSVIVYGPK